MWSISDVINTQIALGRRMDPHPWLTGKNEPKVQNSHTPSQFSPASIPGIIDKHSVFVVIGESLLIYN